MNPNRRRVLQSGLAAAGAQAPSWAFGASWPSKPVRLVVPFAPGGGVDVSTRMLADQLRVVWGGGRSAIVDNKPGANTVIAATAALNAPKDDHTFLATINLTRQLPYLGQKLPFDPQVDLLPIGASTVEQLVLVVNAGSGVTTFDDFVNLARRNPQGVNFGSFATGSLAHLAAAQIARQLKLQITPIHYKGVAPAVQSLLAGEIDAVLSNLGTVQQHIAAGKLVPLAVTGPKRYKFVPNLPTMKELGIPDLEYRSWVGVFAPNGTSAAVIEQMSVDMRAALQAPALVDKISSFYQEPGQFSPAEFQELLREDDRMTLKLIQTHGIRLD